MRITSPLGLGRRTARPALALALTTLDRTQVRVRLVSD
jgi:hypothetical protein